VITDYKLYNSPDSYNPHLLWDTLKCVLRGYIIEFSAQMKKSLYQKRNNLMNKMQFLHSALQDSSGFTTESLLDQINLCQIKLDQLLETETKGAIVRNTAKWGEKH